MLSMYVCHHRMELNLNNDGRKIKIEMKGENHVYLHTKAEKKILKNNTFWL